MGHPLGSCVVLSSALALCVRLPLRSPTARPRAAAPRRALHVQNGVDTRLGSMLMVPRAELPTQ
jgi:hypothetical protein